MILQAERVVPHGKQVHLNICISESLKNSIKELVMLGIYKDMSEFVRASIRQLLKEAKS